jgi:hypothetical protein
LNISMQAIPFECPSNVFTDPFFTS